MTNQHKFEKYEKIENEEWKIRFCRNLNFAPHKY